MCFSFAKNNASNFRALFLLTTFSFFLVSCTTVAPPQAPQVTTAKPTNEKTWKSRENTLAQVKSWQVTGKIAVRTPKNSGTANVNWRENHGNYSVALSGPIGAGAMSLRGTPSSVTLTTSDGKKYSSGSAEQLLAQNWGFSLPVAHIRYWIKGLPVPGIPYKSQFDLENRLVSLQQAGFFIQYSNYTRSGSYDLPHRISMSSAQLKTKIVIYDWRIF